MSNSSINVMFLNHRCTIANTWSKICFLDQNQNCVLTTLLYSYQTFQVYNQSVVIVKAISSQSLHNVLLTLIILQWIVFFFNVLIFFLKIYGIKCTGSVSSSLWIEMLLSAFFFFSLSVFTVHIREGLLSTALSSCYGINS